ncbi:sulfite exporter TauE/SafE family protein [Nocardioides allogilvus]|uniref:sulfite exporter TauE/SafE family protein n=1 Tax=Nocardioides allogilvus TaxID=2072017 RepID=UPI00130024E2|nr:sulfite exporter TauE/SafE family protein [Nocardioides allogilvus]
MTELLVVAGIGVVVFLLAALAQAVSGFGSALVAVPLLALAVGPSTAVVAATVISMVISARAWRREPAEVDRPLARTLTVAGVLGMPCGLLVLTRADDRTLTLVVAVALLVAVALMWSRVVLPTGRRSVWASGVTSGLLLTATGMNGPPLVLSLQAAGLPPRRFRATLQAVFCGQGAVAVTAFALTGQLHATTLAAIAGGVVGLPAGWAVGNRIFQRLSPEQFRSIVLSGLVVTAVVALGNVFVGA